MSVMSWLRLRIENSNLDFNSSINREELDEMDDTLGTSSVRFFFLFTSVLIPRKKKRKRTETRTRNGNGKRKGKGNGK